MNILIVSTSECTGGAAIAAKRLMQALNKAGHSAKMLVRDKQTNDANVTSINTCWWKKKINFIRFAYERWVIFVSNRFSKKNLFDVSTANTGTDISRHPLVQEADVIHLHWTNQGFLSLNGMRKLMQAKKPLVWTMHDMWAYTGICHYAGSCERYHSKCHSCPFLRSPKKKDLSTKVFCRKKKIMEKANVAFVGCSRWIAEQAQKSSLLRGQLVCSIPNPIDATVFYSAKNKLAIREALGLPTDKHLLLFGALNISNKRKGIDYLVKAIQLMPEKKDVAIVTFGQAKAEIKSLFQLPVYFMGYLKDDERIAQLYNAVDIYVTPSLEDNLPNTIMEAMSCGTPCVGFNIGGIPEMIDHKVNGYVAAYKSSEDLAAGICWCLNPQNRSALSEQALLKVKSSYAESVVAKQYVELYSKMIG
jgi:glycosyltransferase involved in cell wall biosynthesis